MKGYIHSVETFGAVDGPGIRYVLFMQGCPLRCLFCHNPDSWKIKSGMQKTVNQVVKDVLQYKSFIKSGGVTISGGEPLLQLKFVYKLTKALHRQHINVAIDTAGSIPINSTKKVIKESDMLLLDIKSLDKEMNKTITGIDNKNNLDTLNYCESIQKPVWIRHVILPNYTLNYEQLENLAKFLSNYNCVRRIDLLPFHKMGEFKWKNLNYDYKLYDIEPPTIKEMEKAKSIFKKYKLNIF